MATWDRRSLREGFQHDARLLRALQEPFQPQGGADWHAERLRGNRLTASKIASLLGENRYTSRWAQVFREADLVPQQGSNAFTEHGNKHEADAVEHYERATGQVVYAFGCIQHPSVPFLAASPDGMTNTGRAVEVKCPVTRVPDAVVPMHYRAQCQLVMEVLQTDVMDFIQYVPPSIAGAEPVAFVVTEVAHDPGWIRRVRPVLELALQDIAMGRELIKNAGTILAGALLARHRGGRRGVRLCLALHRWRAVLRRSSVFTALLDTRRRQASAAKGTATRRANADIAWAATTAVTAVPSECLLHLPPRGVPAAAAATAAPSPTGGCFLHLPSRGVTAAAAAAVVTPPPRPAASGCFLHLPSRKK